MGHCPVSPPANLAGKTIAVVANYDAAMAPIAAELPKAVKDRQGPVHLGPAGGCGPRHPIPLNWTPRASPRGLLKDFEKNPKVADAIIVGNGF